VADFNRVDPGFNATFGLLALDLAHALAHRELPFSSNNHGHIRIRMLMKYSYAELAKMIDHSLLHPTMTDPELEDGCRLAAQYGVASVCLKPYFVRRAAELLKGTGVIVGAVIGFPHGNSATEVKRYEAELACRDGAREIDMVINLGKALGGEWDYVENDIKAVCDEAHRQGAKVKVIFENDYLANGGAGLGSDKFKIKLCQLAERAGADWVKTSTGYGFVKGADGKYSYQGATEHDLKLMRATCSPKVQVKAAGSVRDLDALMRVRSLGVTRCGATATATMLDEFRRREALEKSGESRKSESASSSLGTGGY
jgi:deoxyribose-phosphate aldolase